MSIRDLIKEENRRKQEEANRPAIFRKDAYRKGRQLFADFHKRYYSCFRQNVKDLARSTDRMFLEKGTTENCFSEFILNYKIKEGLLGSLFPKRGGAWVIELGVTDAECGSLYSSDRVDFYAARFTAYGCKVATRLLADVPEDMTNASKWFSEFLLQGYKFSEKVR